MSADARKWWVLTAMGGVLAMVVLDQTAVGVALPSIRRELGLSVVDSHWIVNVYLLALTGLAAASGQADAHRPGSATVMMESVTAALSFIRSRAEQLGLEGGNFSRTLICTCTCPPAASPRTDRRPASPCNTALVSLLTNTPVRPDVAMTGEITLRGNVLQIGGVKEKLLAAHRAGIKRVIIPDRNVKDLVDVPDEVKDEIEIIPVKRMDEVLLHSLTKPPEGIAGVGEPPPVKPPQAARLHPRGRDRRRRTNDWRSR